MNFWKLSDEDQHAYFMQEYSENQRSWKDIAEELGTNATKVRRRAKALGIKSRSRAEAQAAAIASGRAKHPTKGKNLSDETKNKLSKAAHEIWNSMSEAEREARSLIAKELWESKSDQEKRALLDKAMEAMRQASREGSKAEKYLRDFLMEAGYNVRAHVEQILQNERFHIDILLPDQLIAIEVDGPTHDDAIFGEHRLNKRRAADARKTGLILGLDLVLIRVKCRRRNSRLQFQQMGEDVLREIKKIEKSFPPRGQRIVEVNVNEVD